MAIRRYYLLLYVMVLIYACDVKAQCVIDQHYIQNHQNYLFTASKNGHFRLLLNEIVPEGATLYITCNKQLLAQRLCTANDNFDGDLPTQYCSTEPIMVIVAEDLTADNLKADIRGYIEAADLSQNARVTISDGLKLVARQSDGQEYTVFRVGFEDNHGFMDLYRSLYNNNRLVPTLTVAKYQTYSTGPLTDERPRYWRTDGIGASRAVYDSYFKRNYINMLKRLMNENDLNMLRLNPSAESIIDRGHLTANADFMFKSHRCATFHLINAVPQFNRINHCDWNDVEVFIYKQNYNEATVITGITNDVVSLQGNPLFLHEDRLPVPKWMYKVVLDGAGEAKVFLSYNNIFEQNLSASFDNPKSRCPIYSSLNPKPNPPCVQVSCPAGLRSKGDGRFLYCCNAADFRSSNSVLTKFY